MQRILVRFHTIPSKIARVEKALCVISITVLFTIIIIIIIIIIIHDMLKWSLMASQPTPPNVPPQK